MVQGLEAKTFGRRYYFEKEEIFAREMAILVAVSIPIFTSQLEKSREATDTANLRAAKAAAVTAYLDGAGDKYELVAVSIPIFTSQLEKSREATDLANFRAAKAQVVVDYLSGELLPQGWYDASKGVFVEEQGEIAAFGKGTEIPGQTAVADDENYIEGYYKIDADYQDAMIVCVYDPGTAEIPAQVTLKWVREGEAAIGGEFSFDPSKQ